MSFLFPRQDPPLQDRRELLDYFERGAKTAFRVGIEMELLPVTPTEAGAVAADGPCGIEGVLRAMAELPGYEPTIEDGRVVLLRCAGRTVGLEPGGQLELSGTPQATLSAVAVELDSHLDDLARATADCPIAWLALGAHPLASLDEVPWVPKSRYRILAGFLARRGPLSHHMMKRTATIQASFDYGSVADALFKLRIGLLATPVIIALSASSPYDGGRFSGFMSGRSAIWAGTDPTRSGSLTEAMGRAYDLEEYVDHVLDLPMVFLQRGSVWRDGGGLTFREFMDRGLDGERATLSDWELHLSSFFPDVRLKHVLEVRSADCPPRRLMIPLAAFMTGLLYTRAAWEAVEERLGRLSIDEHAELKAAAARAGMAGRVGSFALGEISSALLDGAAAGLRERAAETGVDESALLEPLRQMAADGRSPAHDLLDRFGETITDRAAFVAATSIHGR